MLRDRIEISDDNYNIYTDYLNHNRKKAISVIYIEHKSHCDVIYSETLDIDESKDKKTQLVSLHNSVLAKLFKTIRDNKNRTIKDLLNPEPKNSINTIEKSSKNSSNSNEDYITNSEWISHCRAKLPDYVDICCAIDGNTIDCYTKDDKEEFRIAKIKSILAPIKSQRAKIENIIGSIGYTFYNDGVKHYIFFPLGENSCIGVISKIEIPIGRQLKELERFIKEAREKGYHVAIQS